jgi:hypothetical protein
MIGDGDGDCGEIGGMKIDRGKRSTRRNPAPNASLSITIDYSCCSGWNPMGGSCEHGNETSGYIKCWKILE